MNDIQRAAYIISQAAYAQIEAMAMMAFNKLISEGGGTGRAYTYEDFMNLQNKYGIHHNAVIGSFHR
jgi:hypothetical protein